MVMGAMAADRIAAALVAAAGRHQEPKRGGSQPVEEVRIWPSVCCPPDAITDSCIPGDAFRRM